MHGKQPVHPSDIIRDFEHHMASAGIIPARPLRIIPDGKPHRFPTASHPHKRNGSYSLTLLGDTAHGFFQDWSLGDPIPYYAGKSLRMMTEEERETYARERLENKRRIDEETRSRHESAATYARKIFNRSPQCMEHPYLQQKGIPPIGDVRIGYWSSGVANTLIIPQYDLADGGLISLQGIYWTATGFEKRYLFGGRRGAFILGDMSSSDYMVVCEGYATGVSIHISTGLPVAVAFDTSRLKKTALLLQEYHRRDNLIIAEDNDEAGIVASHEAALAVDGFVAKVPLCEDGGDFNDLHFLFGEQHVLNEFRKAIKNGRISHRRRTSSETSGSHARPNRHSF